MQKKQQQNFMPQFLCTFYNNGPDQLPYGWIVEIVKCTFSQKRIETALFTHSFRTVFLYANLYDDKKNAYRTECNHT